MKLKDYLEQFGYDDKVKTSWKKPVELWKSWYKGKVKAFHNYSIYNGKRNIRMERLSLQMAKKCCEDWADLLFNERCKISLASEQEEEKLNSLLTKLDFWNLINQAIEQSGSTGTGALVTSVTDLIYNVDANVIDATESRVKLEYVDIENIYPISWDGKNITECAFAAKRTIKGQSIVYVSTHLLNEQGNYVIYNSAFIDQNGNLKEIDTEGIITEFNTGSNIPWFAMLSPAGTNNVCPDLPWGVPYYANAIDTLKAIDTAYDSLNNEILLGRKRVFVRQELMSFDSKGEELVFDESDIAYYMLPKGMQSEDLIQPENSELRIEEHQKSIELHLNMFSQLVGFGQEHYKMSNRGGEQTATAVISNNSAMFRRKKKHETPLESALYDVIQSIAYASSNFGIDNINTDGLVISFDDSITEDKEQQALRAMREVSAGILGREEYREIIFGETPEIAQKRIQAIDESIPNVDAILDNETA